MNSTVNRLRTPVLLLLLYFAFEVFNRYTFGWSLPLATALLVAIIYNVILKEHINHDVIPQATRAEVTYKVPRVLIMALLAVSLILGHHIHISGGTYAGTMAENYIDPYSWFDAIAFICIFFVLILAERTISQIALTYCSKAKTIPVNKISPIPLKPFLVASAIVLALWLPYLLTYWPGLIFGDTLSSFNQMFSGTLSNHHPVAFTLAMKLCVQIATAIGFGRTTGIALYTITQMLFMALCLGYLSVWFIERLGIRKHFVWLPIALFSLSPYIATYSIALWKDPVFSCCICMISTVLADAVLSEEGITSRLQTVSLCFFSLIAMLFRNNGAYIVVALILLLAAASIVTYVRKKSLRYVSILLPLCISLTAYGVISGPVYSALHVTPTEKVESLGIPLSQMARVAALNGDMSDSDRAYMNSLLPLDQYKDKYRPTCTDMLKWDPVFNAEPLNNDFWSHWVSMLIRNPRVYFEAWEMQTFGYWTVNVPAAALHTTNIDAGVPRNVHPEHGIGFDIASHNLLGSETFRTALPLSSYSISGGMVFWILIAACLILIRYKKRQWMLPLLPLLLLYGTLFVASPIWYWPRYIFAAQLAIPVVIVLVYRAVFDSKSTGAPDSIESIQSNK